MTAVLGFKTTYKGDKATHWVHLAPSHAEMEKSSTWHMVERLRPFETQDESVIKSPSYQAMAGRWGIIGPKFEAWLEGSEIPEDGTPLAAWGGLTADQAEVFRGLKIRTVEEVSKMQDNILNRIPLPDARKLRSLAQDFLANKDAAQKDAELAELREQMAAMQAAMNEQKPKRGRPPKDEAA